MHTRAQGPGGDLVMLTDAFLLESGPGMPAENMACDEALLEAVADLELPVLRFYSWTQPAATFGYFQNYAEVEPMTSLRPLLRRPTGGGLVPHDHDWTYSLAFPPRHSWYHLRAIESYRLLHQWIQKAFLHLRIDVDLAAQAAKSVPGQCFAGPDQFDVLWQQRKIAGAAQRRNKLGLLIQGSVQPISEWDPIRWKAAFLAVARQAWNTRFLPFQFTATFQQRVQCLADSKYRATDYHRRR